jgi:hypothetical protein
MKKVLLVAVVAAFAASPALAAKKSKKMRHHMAAQSDSFDNSKRFVRDAMPIFLPTWMLPIYLKHKADHH